jgi:putative transposase
MKQQKAYKYRLYPTEEQVDLLAKTFGCCRYVYNWALRQKTDAYYQRGERLSSHDLSLALTALKQQVPTSWLNEVASVPMQQALRHLDKAFLNFFEGRAEYPTFKKKHGDQSATYVGTAFQLKGTILRLSKIEEPLQMVWSRPLPEGCKPSSVTVSKDTSDRYFVSVLVEEEIKPLDVTPKVIGLDLGLKSMVITSDGQTHGNPKFFILDSLSLDIRHWVCPECGVAHDRDINAARNVLAAGLAMAGVARGCQTWRGESSNRQDSVNKERPLVRVGIPPPKSGTGGCQFVRFDLYSREGQIFL